MCFQNVNRGQRLKGVDPFYFVAYDVKFIVVDELRAFLAVWSPL